MSDEQLPPEPDHHWSPGCCDVDRHHHLWSPDEIEAHRQWFSTEPGLIQRVDMRRAQLGRLEALGAPEIIIENQRRLIREAEADLEGGS